jgi:hypothetical protein
LGIPALLYALGPWGGLYFLGQLLPGGRRLGPPVLDWFLVAFALAMLAAAGADWALDRWRWRDLGFVLAAVLFIDLWCCNSLLNPLAYARDSYQNLYGAGENVARYALAAPQMALSRFYSPVYVSDLGPMLHPLDLKFETTYGYFALEPGAYAEYLKAAASNRKLLDGLNVGRMLNVKAGQIDMNAKMLPRAYFPRAVSGVPNPDESLKALATLDPSQNSLVMGSHAAVEQDALATTFVVSSDERSYRVHYQSRTQGLLKLSVAWFPGWRAVLDRRELPVLRVDHALMGVVVPEGEGEVAFEFHSNYFSAGMIVSLIATFVLLALAWTDRAKRHSAAPEGPYTLQRRGKHAASVG